MGSIAKVALFLGLLLAPSVASMPAAADEANAATAPTAVAANRADLIASFPPPSRLVYAVLRDGSKIGTQVVEFVRDKQQLTVRVSVDIKYKLLGITIFRFTHRAEELWRDGRLVRLTSHTDDDGDARLVDLRAEGDRLRGNYNGIPREFPATIIPASFWHPEAMAQTVLLDPVKGRERNITVADKGVEEITVLGKKVKAHHYVLSGQIKRDIWYGPDGQIAQLRLPGKDGSEVTLVLR